MAAPRKEKRAARLIGYYVARNGSVPVFIAVPEQAPAHVLAGHVLRLAWPSVAEQLFFGLAQMAILTTVGELGASAISAVGVSNQLEWFFVSGFFALGAGATAVVARSIGCGDLATARAAAQQAAAATFAAGVLLGLAGWLIAPSALLLMGLDPFSARLATPYLRLLFVSLVFMATSMCLGASLRGAGDTRTPMAVNAVRTVLNVVIAWLLVPGRLGFPALGLTGAGLSFLITDFGTCIAFLWITASGRCGLPLYRWGTFRPDWGLLRRIATVGIPSAIEQLAMSAGILMFVRIVTSLGTRVYAAHQIAVNLTNLTFPISMGFAIAATALVGQALGAQRPSLAERYAYTAQGLGFLIVTSISLTFAAFGYFYAGLYTAEEDVRRLAAVALQIASVSQPALAVYSVLAGGLRGAGDTRWPLYLTLAGIWGVRLTLGYLTVLQLGWGLYGVWGATACDQWARSLLVILRFRTRRWQTVRV